jgi:hypothetical protein
MYINQPNVSNLNMARKRITVTSESPTGRNQKFHDNFLNKDMSRPDFVKAINNGEYGNFHVRNINGIPTPVSNPDGSTNNNLG